VIAQLGSDDPRLRQSALDELMKIKAPDLAKIRDAAISQGPLLPGQVAALREAVTQIYLAAQRYPVDPDYYGFIGLRWSPELAHSTPVVVDERIPGFPAYEFLQPGDVILQFTDWPAVQLRVPDDFILIARRLSAGDPLRLTVRRDGRPIVITMKFDYFPGEVTPTNIDAWIQDRARKAEAYWNSEFSAVDPAAAPMATQASTSVQP
jgi:S1-C subfamily serine protease